LDCRQFLCPQQANLEYVGKIPNILYYGVDEMSASERNEFLAWYKGHKVEIFDNRRVLESYSQDDVNVLREACRVLRQQFMHTGNSDVFLESVTIASACSKVLCKQLLKPDTIGLIPPGDTAVVSITVTRLYCG